MKQPGTLLRHDDRDYLFVEGGYNEPTRAVILLARPGDPSFPGDPRVPPLTWAHQGQWVPVARSAQGELLIPDERHAARRELVARLLAEYERGRSAGPVQAWVGRHGEGLAGTLEAALPMGLAVTCATRRETAAALPGVDEPLPVENLGMFFTHLVREGYAGAMWNGTQPVFFCADEAGDLQFLRVKPGARGATVELETLGPADLWEPYEGAEEIAFIDNREACDRRLVQALGAMPLMDWPEDGRLWSVGPRAGEPLVLPGEAEDEPRHALLFTSEAAARAWRDERDEEPAVHRVDDLGAFLTQEALHGCVARLNPGAHRVNSATLWSDGERIVLDSFSGFWRLEDGAFHPIE